MLSEMARAFRHTGALWTFVHALVAFLFHQTQAFNESQIYIVHMGAVTNACDSEAIIAQNHDLLISVMGSAEAAQSATLYHYSRSFRGFAAHLTPEHVTAISRMEGVMTMFPSRTHKLHTTRSWDFLGLTTSQSMWPSMGGNSSGADVIIGMIDSGIWPEAESFNDDGMPPIPTSWKGECVQTDSFSLYNCNRKLIGARFYSKNWEAQNGPLDDTKQTFFRSPRDAFGHGTHAASIAAGTVVHDASVLNSVARGTARGGAPNARLAIYKVCWFSNCQDADILAAFDDAISDGVHILSLSLGPDGPFSSFLQDSISLGSLFAVWKGIFVSCSGGNSGLPSTVVNIAPWIMTVAASSIDRDLESAILLGNSMRLKGESVNVFKEKNTTAGIVMGADSALAGVPATNASFCHLNTLDPMLVKGNIVVCLQPTDLLDSRPAKAEEVKLKGGKGMILIDEAGKNIAFGPWVVPTSTIGHSEALKMFAYMNSTMSPIATICNTKTRLHVKSAPKMAVFSSQGPNSMVPDILKPDITAPGLGILSAWPPMAVTSTAGVPLMYNIVSGTSMACPHVTGLAALIKAKYPSWSPAAIKSAIMTTATVKDSSGKPISKSPEDTVAGPFDFGAGQLNPKGALDPGLVYDSDMNDLIAFLCHQGTTSEQLRNMTRNNTIACPSRTQASFNLNYPSIAVAQLDGNATVYRTLTNVGLGPTTYKAIVEAPFGVEAEVVPNKLQFQEVGQKLSFKMELRVKQQSGGQFVFGSITWIDHYHVVTSPIAVNTSLSLTISS